MQSKNVTITEKSFGRGAQPVGRRLFLQTFEGRDITVMDFRNVAIAERIENLLKSVIKG